MSEKTVTVKSEVKSLAIVVIIAMFIRTFVFELFYVPTPSMQASILVGDYIFSTKYNYGYSIYSIPFNPDIFVGRIFANMPEIGDVVIMRPPHMMHERYVKRLIALPGDKIQIIDDLIYLNDKPIKRIEVGEFIDDNGIIFRKFRETLPNGSSYFVYKLKTPLGRYSHELSNFGPHTVEADRYFFLGDNRDNSGDSRYQLSTVPFKNLIAKGQFVFFSIVTPLWDAKETIIGQIKRVGAWATSLRFNRFFTSLYEPNELILEDGK